MPRVDGYLTAQQLPFGKRQSNSFRSCEVKMGSRADIVIVFVVLGCALLVSGAPIVRTARRRRRLARFWSLWRGGRGRSHCPHHPPEPPEHRDPSAPPVSMHPSASTMKRFLGDSEGDFLSHLAMSPDWRRPR